MAQLNLLKSKRFYPLFWTQFFGAFNDNFLKNALVIMVTYRSATVLGMPHTEIVALAGGLFILPFFLFSAVAGQLADKFEKTKLIRYIKGAEILIMFLATYGLFSEKFGFLLFVLFLMGLHSTFFGPIKFSILPQHLQSQEMVAGNALVEAGTFLAILLGTIGGGVLIQTASGPAFVSISLIAIAISGFVICLYIPKAPPVDPGLKVEFDPIRPTYRIVQTTRETRSVFLSILGISWFWFFGGVMLSIFPSLCKDVLGANGNVVTLFLAMFSIGIATGSMLCERLSRRRLELGLVPLGSIGVSLFTALLGWISIDFPRTENLATATEILSKPRGLLILVILFLLSMFSGFFTVPLYTMMQEHSPAKLRSRIVAGGNVMNAIFMVASTIMLIGLYRLNISIPHIIILMAILNAVVASYIFNLLPEFLFRFLAWGLAQMIYRLRVTGEENIPQQGPALLICNHITFVDWLILSAGVGRPIRFVMDHGFFKGFFLKRLMKRAKVIPIAPAKEDPYVLESAFAQVAQSLNDGHLVCIFPEGRITSTGDMNPFKPGVLRALQTTPVPVIPMALNGLWGSLFSRKDKSLIQKRPRKFWAHIELRIGQPIPATSATVEKMRAAVESLRD